MARLAGYMKPYVFYAVLAPLLMVAEVFVDVYQPMLMTDIINVGIANQDVGYVMRIGALMLALTFIGALAFIGCAIFASISSYNFANDLRLDLFKKIQSFSFSNLDMFKGSSLITRLTNDVTQVQNAAMMMMRLAIRAPLLLIGALIMSISLNFKLSTAILIMLPVLVFFIFFIIKRGFPYFTIVQQKLDKLNAVVRENLTNVRVVKAFVRERHEEKRFCGSNAEFRDIAIKAFTTVGLMGPVIMFIMNIGTVVILWFGGNWVVSGEMDIGSLLAFVQYVTMILLSLMLMTGVFMMLSRAKVSAERIAEVMAAQPDIKNAEDAEEVVIEKGEVSFDKVDFSYPTTQGLVLKDISFCARAGEKIGILGATGSGKSTLVNLIPRLYDVSGGHITIDGVDVKNFDLYHLRTQIGMVPQDTILFSGTIADNIRWGNKEADDDLVYRAAKAAMADEFIKGFQDGYETVLGQRGVNLSGGQKQRIAIARALIKNPRILILDDSTSALDLETEAKVWANIRDIATKSTIFLVAQRVSSVLDADKIIVLDNGEIAGIGKHDALMKTCEIYRTLFMLQLGGREDASKSSADPV